MKNFREAFVASFSNGGGHQDARSSHGLCSCGSSFLCFFDRAPTRAKPKAARTVGNGEDGEVGD